MTWTLDLDGVVWVGEEPVPGAQEAVERLRAAGQRVAFLTNNSNQPASSYVAKLERMGIAATPDDVITSAQAAAALLDGTGSAMVCAGPGVTEALEERGIRPVHDGPADAVVVGWHKEFDYARLRVAATAVMKGARLVGTNDDATYPTPEGPIPGGGSLLAAVACAAGATPEVAGKPHEPMAALVRERVGDVEVVVGDRPSTDGLLARRLGARFVLVLTGVTGESDLPVEPEPDEVAPDLAAVVDAWEAERTG